MVKISTFALVALSLCGFALSEKVESNAAPALEIRGVQDSSDLSEPLEKRSKRLKSNLDLIPSGATVNYQVWNLTETEVMPDGHYRRGFLINGESPGPLIDGNQGDWVVIKVNNFLTVPITIHFHGIHQNGTIFSDGVPGVTQWPILSGDTYTYVWKMDQYGFYWYHAHYRAYANDGIIGPIYINPSDEVGRPYGEITNDTDELSLLNRLEKKPNYLILSDWFKETYDEIAVKMFAYGMDPSCVQSLLINGKGRHYCFPNSTFASQGATKYEKYMGATGADTWHMDSFGCMDLGTLNGFTSIEYNTTLLEFPGTNTECFNSTVDQEVYYTNDEDYVFFNLINMGGEFSKTLSVDDHNLTVVAIDGSYIHPKVVQQLYLPIGLRVTVAIKTVEDEHENTDEPFAIRVQGDDMPQLYTGLAYLQYGSYSNETYQYVQESVAIEDTNGVLHNNLAGDLLDSSFIKFDPFSSSPLDSTLKPPTGAADVTIQAELTRPGSTTFTIFNGVAFDGGMEMNYPILFKLQGNDSINATQAFGGSVVDAGIKEGDVVDIIFQNTPLADHPMHLHGHTFWVIAKNDTVSTFAYNTTEEALEDGSDDLFNFEDPAYVDNVAVITGGYAIIRFIASNNIAMVHCHIQTHLAMGMGGVIVEDKEHLDKVPENLLKQNHADYNSQDEWIPSELNITIT
ncbi:hypothetical protein PSN45_000006 [Yamadazyma tenuis]|uniref:Multicopper oxidase n=1 Tax=Candida tenuis (strain ATCC 10573 / BCRC 21748 / CBS 615 / JCM 9827 / NBRC 10315 / NRRL Y-1498 / VKM Y-70) TaxID=590646 RepID=G3B9W6_CANTC|nr:uncharacterized protein CANTEDRAFT_94251 [Yamadazyma tenuis ATCC 10573]EGV61342.1 hypothetical protein CANTEDRAFT_94251 [Yamadazyma tenuis ATCC 10573]WEJ92556.1 hypothetical protein PSN45_000006 [Yamadazyma tenuis]